MSPSVIRKLEFAPPILVMMGAVLGAVVLVQSACASWKQAAKTVLDIADVACIINNAFLQDDKIADVCRVTNDLRPQMDKVLASHRAGVSRQLAAARCSGQVEGDAGARDAARE